MRDFKGWCAGVALALVATACAATASRLDEQIAFFHDDLRWGRMPSAEEQVVPRARVAFIQHHAGWGTAVQIVDMENEGTRVQGLTGIVRTRYSWTRGADPDMRQTVIQSRWRGVPGGTWLMEEERVVAGDPALLALR